MPSKAAQLIPLNLSAPGAAGLTGETSMAGDKEEWLFEAHNAVYNNEGLLAPRRLWRKAEWTGVYDPQPFPEGSIVYPAFAAGIYFAAGDGKIWVQSGTDLTTLANNGTAPTVWGGAVPWKAVYLNRKWFLFAEGKEAKVYDPYAAAGAGHFSGVPNAPEVGVAHSAFGRLWAASTMVNDRTLYWSMLLDGNDWTSAGTGSLDLASYMGEGEAITAIADFNGLLIVFTNLSILIFQDPFLVPIDSGGAAGTASVMSLKEQIKGTGCVGRNAWCNIGAEIIFMSHNGLKSLGRVLQDGGSNPLDTVCPQIASVLMNAYKHAVGTAQNLEFIRLNYHPAHGFVTVETGLGYDGVYLLWVNRPLDRGIYPVTRWGKLYEEIVAGNYTGLMNYSGLYPTGGWAGVGPGITAILIIYDNLAQIHYHGFAQYGMMSPLHEQEVCEQEFTFLVKSAWLTFGDQASPLDKIPKDLKLIYRTPQAPQVESGDYEPSALTVTFGLRFDYNSALRSHTFTTPLIQQQEFDVSTQVSQHTVTPIPLAGQGSLVQWEIRATVNNRAHEAFAVQRAGFQTKIGRIHQGI